MSSEDAIRRTRKQMMSRPELVEHLSYRHWLHERGAPDSSVERACYEDLPDSRKQEVRLAMWEAMEAYWALSDEERRSQNTASLALELARNDARCIAIESAALPSPSDTDGAA